MTLVQTPPKKIYMWVESQEYISFKIKTDSYWQLQVPRAWYASNGTLASYNWKISYDWWAETTYSWTGSDSSNILIASWLTANSEHTVTITPVVEDYWWARAFWFYTVGSNTNINLLLTEVVYDWSYKWYWVSATNTWDYFRWGQYRCCSNLTKPPEEVLPNTVTTIWNLFRWWQYTLCTSLTYSPEEALPSSVTSIWSSFRNWQYQNCTWLTEIKWWKDLDVWNSYYRYYQYQNCSANKTVKVLSDVWYASYDWNTLANSYITTVQVPNAYLTNFTNSTKQPRSSITDSKFVWY